MRDLMILSVSLDMRKRLDMGRWLLSTSLSRDGFKQQSYKGTCEG